MSFFEQSQYYFNYTLPEQIFTLLNTGDEFLGKFWWVFLVFFVLMFLIAMRYFRRSIQQKIDAKIIDDSLRDFSTKKDLQSVAKEILKSVYIFKAYYLGLYEQRGETFILVESNLDDNKDVSIPLRIGKRELHSFKKSGKYEVDVFIGNDSKYMTLLYSKEKLNRRKYSGYLDFVLSYYGSVANNLKAKGNDNLLTMSKNTSASLMKLQMDNTQFFKFFVALVMKITDAQGAKLLTKSDELLYEFLNVKDTKLQKVFFIRNTPYKLEYYDKNNLDQKKIVQIGSFLDMAGGFLVNIDGKSEMVKNYLELLKFTNEGMEIGNAYYRDHSLMVQTISVEIAKSLFLSEAEIDAISLGAYLHDIGMVGDVFSVLEKDDIEEAEMDLIKEHPLIGSIIVEPIAHVYPIIDIVKYHHERFDGKGYPFGLKDSEIPLSAQAVALGEFYTGITGDRPYRKGKTHAEALVEVEKMKDKMFASVVVEAFLDVEKSLNSKIIKIKSKWGKDD